MAKCARVIETVILYH